MNLTRWAAVHGLIPPGMKTKALRDQYLSLLCTTYEILEQETSKEQADLILSKIGFRMGLEAAEILQEEVGLPNSLQGAIDAWTIGGHALGVKIRSKKHEAGEDFEHLTCPLHAFFTSRELDLCHAFCLPQVESTAQAVYPDVLMRVTRHPDLEQRCIKGLYVEA